VLRATESAHIDEVSNWLRVSARVGEITPCRTDTELRTTLRSSAEAGAMPAFVVIVAPDEELPPALLRYPDLRVLVLTTRRKVGPLTPWLQRGASDVASLTRTAHVQHALSRLIDECGLNQQVQRLQHQLALSDQRLRKMIEQSAQAMSWWRNKELLACNGRFTQMTGLTAGASDNDWFNAFDANSRAQLGEELHALPESVRAVALENGQTLRIQCSPVNENQSSSIESSETAENFISVKVVVDTKVVAEATATQPAPETDSASGLPARQTVVNTFQTWLGSGDEHARFVAMMVDLSDWAMSETQSITEEDANDIEDVDPSSTYSTTLAFENAASPYNRVIEHCKILPCIARPIVYPAPSVPIPY